MKAVEPWMLELILDLRFDSQTPKGAKVHFASYKSIADVLGVGVN